MVQQKTAHRKEDALRKALGAFDLKLFKKEAAPRFELGVKDLQSSALPLGHAAMQGANSLQRIVSAMACPPVCWF